MQRFGRQHVNGPQKLLRSALNQFHSTLPLILDKREKEKVGPSQI